jgi:hypothetical protein
VFTSRLKEGPYWVLKQVVHILGFKGLIYSNTGNSNNGLLSCAVLQLDRCRHCSLACISNNATHCLPNQHMFLYIQLTHILKFTSGFTVTDVWTEVGMQSAMHTQPRRRSFTFQSSQNVCIRSQQWRTKCWNILKLSNAHFQLRKISLGST